MTVGDPVKRIPFLDTYKECQRRLSMMLISVATILFGSFTAFADLKVVCEARELRLTPGCHATSYKNRFEARYRPNGVALESLTSQLDSEVSFRAEASKSLKMLSARISRGDGQAFTNFTHSGRPADQKDDWTYVSYSEGRSKNLGDCDDKIFEMVCILADESEPLFTKKLSSSFDLKFAASK